MYSQAYILIHMYVMYVYRHLLGFHAVHFFYTDLFSPNNGVKKHNTTPTARHKLTTVAGQNIERCDAPGCSIRYRLTHVLFDL